MLGSVVVHQFAYLVADWLTLGPMAALDHGHIAAQQMLIVPIGSLACAIYIVGKARRLGLTDGLDISTVVALLVALFVGQEAIEFGLQGHSPLAVFGHPPVLVGVVLAPLVVRGFLFTLRRAEVLVRVLLRLRVVLPAVVRRVPIPPHAFVERALRPQAPTRGPPFLVVTSPFAPLTVGPTVTKTHQERRTENEHTDKR